MVYINKWRVQFNDWLMNWLASTAGRSATFYAFVFLYVGWMLWNTLTPYQFDPYPFVFLLFLSNTVQLWYLPVITLQSNIFNTRLQELLEFVREVVLRLVNVEHLQLESSREIHMMLESQKVVLDNIVTMNEILLTTLNRIENKANEIDAEIDEEFKHGSSE